MTRPVLGTSMQVPAVAASAANSSVGTTACGLTTPSGLPFW